MNQWIKVEDELPYNGDKVIVYFTTRNNEGIFGHTIIVYYFLPKNLWLYPTDTYDGEKLIEIEDVTHWMRIPKPPEITK